MKKLFISCPMRGRKDEDIKESMRKMHKIAEIYAGEDLELIDTFLEGADYKGSPMRCLGESIKRMQDADYFIGPDNDYEWDGCHIERVVFTSYKGFDNALYINVYKLMPDVPRCPRPDQEE